MLLFVESVSGAVQQAEIMRSSVNVWLGFFVCVLILLDFEQHSREFVYSNKIAIRSVAVKPRDVFFLVGHLHVWLYSGKQSSTAHPATLHVIKIMRFYPICKWANFMNIFCERKQGPHCKYSRYEYFFYYDCNLHGTHSGGTWKTFNFVETKIIIMKDFWFRLKKIIRYSMK